jgi:hypothetical protein
MEPLSDFCLKAIRRRDQPCFADHHQLSHEEDRAKRGLQQPLNREQSDGRATAGQAGEDNNPRAAENLQCDPKKPEWVTGLLKAQAEELLDWLENHGCPPGECHLERSGRFAVRCQWPPE